MSKKVRIYELAGKLSLESKEVINEARELGIEVKSHSSTVTQEEAELIEESFKEQEKTGAEVPKEKEAEKAEDKTKKPERPEKISDKQKIEKEAEIPAEEKKPKHEPKPVKTAKKVVVDPEMTVESLAELIEADTETLIEEFSEHGILLTPSRRIDTDDAVKVLNKMGYDASVSDIFGEPENITRKNFQLRPPVVTVMGHVDHGKTQLLDTIRHTNIIAKESGGITQHIGASKVTIKGKGSITFIDTPGHEAFTAMRARGAKITDLVILVVAADDGVMPQTVEAINHARAAGVPMIVAINKIDLPEADPEKVKTQLTRHGIVPEDWGGDIITVAVSAKEGTGVNDLLEMILLQSEMMELKAPVEGPAKGVVVESELDKFVGSTATVIITEGTLNTGDSFICGIAAGKVKAMTDDTGKRVKTAGPSEPVKILGFEDLCNAGDIFYVVKDRSQARDLSEKRKEALKKEVKLQPDKVTLEDLKKQLLGEENKELRIILKTDVTGSMEAIRDAIMKFETDEVALNIIHSDVGGITKKDIMLASASDAVIIGFNISAPGSVKKEAEKEGVQIRTYRIIYDILDDIKKALEGMLEPEEKEVVLGRAQIKKIFNITGTGTVAGCAVTEGIIRRSANIRVVRDSRIVYEGKLASLKRFKNDASEVASGYECGANVEGFNDIKEGDILESFEIQERKRSLEEAK